MRQALTTTLLNEKVMMIRGRPDVFRVELGFADIRRFIEWTACWVSPETFRRRQVYRSEHT